MKCGAFFVSFAFLFENISGALIPRIIGGEEASITKFPYMASVRVKGKHVCGGVIIGDKHILTTAHCINRDIIWPYFDATVSTGTGSSVDAGQSHRIYTITLHPKWPEGTAAFNDIAVITLPGELTFNSVQQKIKLASHDVVSGTKGVLTGWGYTKAKSGKFSKNLQKLEMTLLTSKDCQSQHPIKIDKTQLCAYGSFGEGSCLGDSGSPLVVEGEVVGVVSWVARSQWGTGSGEVFSNVFAHRDFIQYALKYT